MNRIKLLIVEDDQDWLNGLLQFLSNESDIDVVDTATTKEEAIYKAKKENIDIVLMDINLSENRLDGIEATIEIQEFSSAKIIMLTSLNLKDIILQSFTAGAVHFVAKEDFRSLPETIRYFYRQMTPQEIMLREFHRLKEEVQLSQLTAAEKEVFALLQQGKSRSEMQQILNKSESTIKNQVKSIIRKLKVNTGRQAVEKVKFRGILKGSRMRSKGGYKI